MVDFKEGVILYVNKPLGWTSFKVVGRVRGKISKACGIRRIKVGHAGTLDPLATGVMVLCTGKATKQIESFQYQTKEYVATLKLGATTPSFDMEHEEDATYPTAHITRELVDEVIPRFTGEIWQVPPVYSAVKVDGLWGYIDTKGELVIPYQYLFCDEPNSGLDLTALERTRVGDMRVEDCWQIDNLLEHIDRTATRTLAPPAGNQSEI